MLPYSHIQADTSILQEYWLTVSFTDLAFIGGVALVRMSLTVAIGLLRVDQRSDLDQLFKFANKI